MKYTLKSLTRNVGIHLVAMAALCVAGIAQAEEAAQAESSARAVALQMEAEVTDIDLETRRVSLRGPSGDIVTLNARENVVKLEDVNVGDVLVVTYLAALEGELREPTEEELAEPWVVLEDGAVSGEGEAPGIGAQVDNWHLASGHKWSNGFRARLAEDAAQEADAQARGGDLEEVRGQRQ